jgi:hypothetical protein
MKLRWIAALTALVVSAGLLFSGAPAARASSKGRLNTTYALGAATIYSLLKGKTTQGLILGAGTAYAYKRYDDAHKAEQRRNYYLSRYYGTPSYYRARRNSYYRVRR